LAWLHCGLHTNQSAVCINRDRAGFLVEWDVPRCVAVDEHRDLYMNPRRPTAVRLFAGASSAGQFGLPQCIVVLAHGGYGEIPFEDTPMRDFAGPSAGALLRVRQPLRHYQILAFRGYGPIPKTKTPFENTPPPIADLIPVPGENWVT
jgi:hypothetical protein